MTDEKKNMAKIKRRLDMAARKITEAREILRASGYPDGIIFAEGSGRLHAMREYGASDKCLVTSIRAPFDAGGW